MGQANAAILGAAGLAVLLAFDLIRGFRRGKVQGKDGTITRKGRPEAFRRYMMSGGVMLVFSIGVILWGALNR
jgi:hypothetical protein